ncbi:type II toxin-antitoxin system CcdA family antitoxin [Roseomonas mucosa]|uniref:type II toxin-antitoxin system CcdA family antitoxin n=1 Tax=Roseomonas mucosa TaxID=207340 RepID=UPI0038509987
MPRGKPKKPTALRLDPDLVAEVRLHASDLTATIEEALRQWLKRAKAEARKRALAETRP